MWSIGHQRTVSTSRDPVLLLVVNPCDAGLFYLLFDYSRFSLVCLSSFVLEDSTGEVFLRCCGVDAENHVRFRFVCHIDCRSKRRTER